MFGLTKNQQEKCQDVYKDQDGYWAMLKPEYRLVGYFSDRIIHEDTLKEFKECFKHIKKA